MRLSSLQCSFQQGTNKRALQKAVAPAQANNLRHCRASALHFFSTRSLISTLFLITTITYADDQKLSSSLGDDYWRCTITDSTQTTWTEYSPYKLAAIAKVSEYCKKLSTNPLSCHILKDSCEHFVHGISTRPLWRCLALDNHAGHWLSHLENNQEAAIANAETQCRQHSQVPDTCYVNQISCRNLNPVSE